jgi:CubicO group peptidase (beta-lactamase class C family)
MMKYIKPFFSLALASLIIFAVSSCLNKRNKGLEAADQLDLLIDSLLQYAVGNMEIPGAVAYISLDGKELYHKAFGWKNIEHEEPLLKNDIFRMASMTKGLTAVAILQLIEEGAMHLDDEVYRYIPEFKNPQILVDVLPDSGFIGRNAINEITIRQLLTHTSGIGYGFQNETYNALIIKNDISEGFEDDNRNAYENIQRIAKLPILFEPGEKYVYGLSYDVLGVVIEQVSGMRFDKYVEQNILDPLNMKDSYFTIPEKEQHRLVSVYQAAENGTGLEPTSYPDNVYPVLRTRQFFSGGADLCSTAEDYARFLQMLLNGGTYDKSRILGHTLVVEMLSKQTPFDDGDYNQGFAAWIINEEGAANRPMGFGSFEFGGFYDTFSWTDPEHNMVAVLLLQMYPANEHSIHQKFQDVVYSIIQ